MSRRWTLAWVCWATLLAVATAQPAVVDGAGEWVVGVSAFVDDGLPPGDRYLLSSIPLLLIERLEPIQVHRLSALERRARGRRVLQAEVRVQSERVSGLQRAISEASLGDGPAASARLQLAEAVLRLEQLRQLDPDDVDVPASKLVVIGSGSDVSQLYQPATFSPQRFAVREGLDLLINGSIGAVDGFLFIDVNAFGTALGERVFSFRDAVLPERVALALDEVSDQLATLLLGSPWATLVVTPNPESAAVRVDGHFVGVGNTTVPFLAAGEHLISVAALGYLTAESVVEMAAGERAALAPELAPVQLTVVAVSSSPTSADLYLDSVWAGRTPLQIPVPPGITRFEVRRDGYHAQSAELSGGSATPLSFTLQPATDDLQLRQEAERTRLYRSLGWFVATTAAPLLLGVAAADATARVNTLGASLGLAATAEALQLRAWLIGGTVTGVVASGVTFVISMFALGDYIQAANRAAR